MGTVAKLSSLKPMTRATQLFTALMGTTTTAITAIKRVRKVKLHERLVTPQTLHFLLWTLVEELPMDAELDLKVVDG